MRLRNNIVYQLSGEIYLDGSASEITGDHNLWFGAGAAPEQTTNNVNADPQFVNPAGGDFHLLKGSPARAAGVQALPNNPFTPGQVIDKDGMPRPPTGSSLGAYEAPR
jgi:hypothetical protein